MNEALLDKRSGSNKRCLFVCSFFVLFILFKHDQNSLSIRRIADSRGVVEEDAHAMVGQLKAETVFVGVVDPLCHEGNADSAHGDRIYFGRYWKERGKKMLVRGPFTRTCF